MKHNRELKGRFIAIFIAALHVLTPLVAQLANTIALSQEASFFGMIKQYVAMGFILNVDDLFHHIFPPEVILNQKELNDSGLLVVSVDNNSTKRVLKRLFKRKNIFNIKQN